MAVVIGFEVAASICLIQGDVSSITTHIFIPQSLSRRSIHYCDAVDEIRMTEVESEAGMHLYRASAFMYLHNARGPCLSPGGSRNAEPIRQRFNLHGICAFSFTSPDYSSYSAVDMLALALTAELNGYASLVTKKQNL